MNDNQNPALRQATNSTVIAFERPIGLAMLAAGAAHLGRLMPAEALRRQRGAPAEELDGAGPRRRLEKLIARTKASHTCRSAPL